MRYLNKIVFINAAAIPYAEILLDGNVHFIGTQGVGKSTLLRAILFFYNADAQHLGISREKKTFSEHYFPNINSYIVYEVMRETGPYCVMAWKSQNRVCFRFFEGPYRRDIFIQDGFAFEGWEKCKNQVDKLRIRHTPKIDNYGEYRDILYGNQDGKRTEYRKYALLESRQYQNIPRTIQNVFLNSKLNAEFIKQTIIQSLNEDDVEIDLTTYTLHLKSFESDLSDIEKFKNPEVRKFAERSARFHLSVLTLTKEYHQFGNQLVYTVEKIKSGLPELQEKYDKEFLKREKVASKLADLDQKQREKELKLMSDIKVIDSQIKRAAEKREIYNSLGIKELLKRQDRKPGLIRERQQRTDEKGVLTAAYANITRQFDDRLKLIEQSYQTELLAKNTEVQVGKENHLNNENAERKLLDAKEIEIKENSKETILMAEGRLDQTKSDVQKGQLALQEIQYKRFFEAEISENEKDIRELDNKVKLFESDIKRLQTQIESWQKQAETESKARQNESNSKLEILALQSKSPLAEMQKIRVKLEKSKESLFAWLNAELPGWEHTIGKVLDEDVLFQDGLSPQKESDGKSSLYGVQIDLSEIEKEPKTLADYEFELSELELQVRNLNDKIEHEKQLCAEDEIRIRNRFHEKIKPAKREVEEKKYTIDQADLEREGLKDRKIILIQKAETEKAKEIALANEKLDAQKEAESQAKLHVTDLKTELDKELSKIRKAFDRKLAELKAEFSLFQNLKNQEKEELLEQRDTRILDLKNEQDGRLKAEGADTDRIKRIDDQIAKIDSELSIIEAEMKTAIEFEQDKRELFDKENGWRQEKSKLQNQLEQAETQFQNQAQKLKSELSDLDEGIRKLGEDLRSSKSQLEAYQKFQQTEVFQGLELLEKGHFLTEKGCEELIQTINTRFNKRISETDLLKEALNIFLGHFTENNIFKFRTKLITTAEYLQFATELKEFFDDARIEEYEKRVTDRFVEIIRTICKQTDNLMSKGGEIQKVISKINSDFVERNFAGVIGKIELRIMDSSDRVVTHLLRIKKFSDENSFDDYSTLPLFATSKSELQNSKAVELLLQLDKEIRDVKKVSLSDSFDLQFRVEENQTDTGWVESLANVGSEGTDVLVKAMINIMLLNVFKENASKKFKDFRLHCMMDEIGKLHPSNVRGILRFANDRNIVLLNGSPTENSNALDYKHIYKLTKDSKAKTKVVKLLSNYSTV